MLVKTGPGNFEMEWQDVYPTRNALAASGSGHVKAYAPSEQIWSEPFDVRAYGSLTVSADGSCLNTQLVRLQEVHTEGGKTWYVDMSGDGYSRDTWSKLPTTVRVGIWTPSFSTDCDYAWWIHGH